MTGAKRKRVKGFGIGAACKAGTVRRLRRNQHSGESEIARSAVRDYADFPARQPNIS